MPPLVRTKFVHATPILFKPQVLHEYVSPPQARHRDQTASKKLLGEGPTIYTWQS